MSNTLEAQPPANSPDPRSDTRIAHDYSLLLEGILLDAPDDISWAARQLADLESPWADTAWADKLQREAEEVVEHYYRGDSIDIPMHTEGDIPYPTYRENLMQTALVSWAYSGVPIQPDYFRMCARMLGKDDKWLKYTVRPAYFLKRDMGIKGKAEKARFKIFGHVAVQALGQSSPWPALDSIAEFFDIAATTGS